MFIITATHPSDGEGVLLREIIPEAEDQFVVLPPDCAKPRHTVVRFAAQDEAHDTLYALTRLYDRAVCFSIERLH